MQTWQPSNIATAKTDITRLVHWQASARDA
jgi:hypothetical protein